MSENLSQFKEISFDTKKELEQWLEKMTSFEITFKDNGFDMQKWWVHESGEILHCDFHGEMYNGSFINVVMLKVGWPVILINSPNKAVHAHRGVLGALIVETLVRKSVAK